MTRRPYRLGKRAETAAARRQRIVEATMALHAEHGIVATSMKDIAMRADVGIGTVYHHFPTYDDIVRACGARMLMLTRPPTPDLFAGIQPVDQRIRRLVQEVFAYYERYPSYERGRCDRDKLPVLAEGVARRERALEAVAQEALRPLGDDERMVATVVALTDFAVYRSLMSKGLATQVAADQVADVLLTWLRSLFPEA
ncbi:MAG: TetR/AcrR family transcriptional regulator [Thermomicrobiales bacterium]